MSPVSAHDTAAATRYSGTITTPPQQAYWVACRASCRNSAEEGSSPYSRVTMTLPRQNAGAGGTGSRYPVPTNSRSALRATRAPPRAATPSPASVDPLARLTMPGAQAAARVRTAPGYARSAPAVVGHDVPAHGETGVAEVAGGTGAGMFSASML